MQKTIPKYGSGMVLGAKKGRKSGESKEVVAGPGELGESQRRWEGH